MDVSDLCEVEKKFRRLYHSGGGRVNFDWVSERRTLAERWRVYKLNPATPWLILQDKSRVL